MLIRGHLFYAVGMIPLTSRVNLMTDIPNTSTVNRCVHGGQHGDFKWPYDVPDGAFGPWSPLCKSEILDPCAPCRPYIPGRPCDFRQLAAMLSEVLQAVVTLCHDIPPEGSNGDPDWIDPRLLAIDSFLDFKWLGCYKNCSDGLKDGVNKYLYVIFNEAILRQNYVYFTKDPTLQAAMKSIYDTFDGCSWSDLNDKVVRLVNIILQYGCNIELMNYQLETQITNTLNIDWVKRNNDLLNKSKDYSLTLATNLVGLNLSLTETLKRYSDDTIALRFEYIQQICKGSVSFNLKYGNSKFNVRKPADFLVVAKAVFGA